MKPTIVAMTGRAGSGKDTAAAYLAQALQAEGFRVEVMALADPIRAMMSALGVPAEYMTDRALKEQEVPGFKASYRHMAQMLGTEWGRQCMGTDFWVRHLEMRIAQACAARPIDFVFVTDVRYPNEAAWVQARGGEIFHVERPGVSPVRQHTSEGQQLPRTKLLHNTGDLTWLRGHCKYLACVISTRLYLAD